MEFPNQLSLLEHLRSFLAYKRRLAYESRLTSQSHSQSHTGGGGRGNDSRLQQHSQHPPSFLVYKSRLTSQSQSQSQSQSHTRGGNSSSRLQQQQQGQSQWDEMPRDILIKIFKLLPFEYAPIAWTYPLVCKSWLYATVDIVYPSFTTVIDLRFLFDCDVRKRMRFMVYLKLVLDTRPQTQWTALYLPDDIEFSKDDFLYIAQRTPCLEYLDWPYCGDIYFHWEAISSWKNLKKMDLGCFVGNDIIKSLPCSLAYNFKNLRCLRLVMDRFGVEEVSKIIKTLFPQLNYFSLQHSSLTMDAASLVVSEAVATNNNSHQVGIQTLDLRHCAFISIRLGSTDSFVKQGLVQAEIHEKAASAIKTYLFCKGFKLCSQCNHEHGGLMYSENYPNRPPRIFVKRNSSSFLPPLGTTKRHKIAHHFK